MNARVACRLGAVLLVLSLGSGCASETKTVTRETTQYPAASAQESSAPIVERQTTETTTETGKGSGGVLSTTVDFMGEVIAFPFRLVGAVASALF